MQQTINKLTIARVYANHIASTNDAITYTARVFDVSPTTIRKCLSYLQNSPFSDDVKLYDKVNLIIKSHKWGKTFIRA